MKLFTVQLTVCNTEQKIDPRGLETVLYTTKMSNVMLSTCASFDTIPERTSQVPPQSLLPLEGLEKTLEVSSAEPVKVFALDYLHEHSRPVSDMFREDLQQVPALIKVDQDVEPFEHIHVRREGPGYVRESLAEIDVVCGGDLEELHPAGLEVCDGCDYVVGAERDVLDASAVVVVHESGK